MQYKSETPLEDLILPVSYIERAKALCAEGMRKILAIAGAPGSGKSTVARLLQLALPDCSVLVPMDGFHLANKELEGLGRKERKGAPDTFDVKGYLALLQRLRNQKHDEVIYAPEFDRTIEEAIAGSIPVFPETELIITEGNYLCLTQGDWQNLAELFDEKWFVMAPQQERQQRLINRHCYFGRTPKEAKTWVEQTDEPNARLIENNRTEVELVIEWMDVSKRSWVKRYGGIEKNIYL